MWWRLTGLCHLLVSATTDDVGVTQPTLLLWQGDRWFPRAFVCKNQGLETFPQAASLHLRLICTRPCLWLCVVAADKVRTDVFGVIFIPLPCMILSSLPPVSSSSNLGLIVFVIKHSCTDPSVNPLTPADYMGVRGALLPHRPVQQPRTPHGNALLAP